MNPLPLLAAGTLALLLIQPGTAATTIPTWVGDADTTGARWIFSTGSTTPTPEILPASYAVPQATITVSPLGAGWQDPGNPVDLSGSAQDGAWDLGKPGEIATDIQVAPTVPGPGFSYVIEFVVCAQAYFGATELPQFTTSETVLGLTQTDEFVAADPLFPGFSWVARTWTGTFTGVETDTITFAIDSDATTFGTVVDSFEVYTRVVAVVPEPSSALLASLGLLASILRRKRPSPHQ